MADKNTNPSGASNAAAATASGNGFVTFPSREGVTHVRAETVDAIEAVDANNAHLVIDGCRLPVGVDAVEALRMLSPAARPA